MGEQITAIPEKRTLNCGGKLIDLSQPIVMGILNVTPDSFYDGGKYNNASGLVEKAQEHLVAGATMIDVGAISTRPNAVDISIEEERERLIPSIALLRKEFHHAVISADTFRSEIAREAVEAGADIINDISGGTMDEKMFETIAELQVPYVLMHIQGTPQTMQDDPQYDDVVEEVMSFFKSRAYELKTLGVHDVILDPGFGFGKTVEHNYSLLKELKRFEIFGYPILCGFSRKSMINRVIGTKPEEALNGTTVLNTLALDRGAKILRVHDVKEAVEAVELWKALEARS